MNWKEFCSKKVPIMAKMKEVKQELSELERAYIDEHKKFSKGDHVVISAKRSTRHAIVYGNKIGDNGRVIPILLIVKKSRTSRPSFYHQHESDESIVIEKYGDDEQQ